MSDTVINISYTITLSGKSGPEKAPSVVRSHLNELISNNLHEYIKGSEVLDVGDALGIFDMEDDKGEEIYSNNISDLGVPPHHLLD